MKLNSSLFAALLFGAAASLSAAPTSQATPVHARPDASAPVIATLQAGSEPVSAPGVTPTGWRAVTLTGPHEVYAANRDVTKGLDVRAGAPYLLDAKADAPAFALAEKGDALTIIDYRGRWTKFHLDKPVTGYIRTPVQTASPVVAAAPSAAAPTFDHTAPVAAAPTQTAAPVSVGRAAPVGDGGSSALPRLFQGTFASTYSPLRPRRPYDFQLNDDAGARYAYVDVSKLLATEQLNKYVGRTVVVYGTARSVGGGREMVVTAESLQLR